MASNPTETGETAPSLNQKVQWKKFQHKNLLVDASNDENFL